MIINRLNVPFVNFQASPIGKQKESLELPFTGLSSDIITFRGKREDKNDKQSQLIKEPISLYVAKTAEDVSKSLSSLKNEERKDSLLMTSYNDTIPLIFFSENNRKTIVKAIIESTPDAETLKQMLTQKDSNGNNALIYALRNDNEEAMQILIDHLIDWTGK